MATQEVEKRTRPIIVLRDLLEAKKPELMRALPKHLTADRLIRVTLTAVQRSPDLLKCTPGSVMSAVMEAAQLGLETDGVLGHAYLVPFKNRKTGFQECQLIIGYKGLIKLARNSGEVVSIQAHVVYEKDDFTFRYGLVPTLEHTPARGNRGEPIAAYAVAQLKDGGHAFEVMWVEDINRVRDQSPGSRRGDSPWQTDWDEMARKTPLRRLAKFLPLSVEFQRAAAMDEAVERGYAPTVEIAEANLEIEAAALEAPVEATAEETLPPLTTADVGPGGILPERWKNGKCDQCGAKGTQVGEKMAAVHLRGCPTQPSPPPRDVGVEG